ncbi:MAG TPA: DPP IV N-terminal domain-containing protein [Gemmatimonadaceae bacterium]|nr:DPP IV N-terminal domain-containing protein [Gemmatimonadaceae bacterium]
MGTPLWVRARQGLHRRLVPALLIASVAPAGRLAAQGTLADYERAARFHRAGTERLVFRDQAVPNWINGTDRFWYRVDTPAGIEYLHVDPDRRTRQRAFDHARLATALGQAAGRAYGADSLVLTALHFLESGTVLELQAHGTRWRCDLRRYACARPSAADSARFAPPAGISPDGRWIAFVRDYDLWLRSTSTGQERALTTDGERWHAYATPLPSASRIVQQETEEPAFDPGVYWSPDAKKLITYRMDSRRAARFTLVQAVPRSRLRPMSFSYAYGLPGDTLASAELVIFDAESGARTSVSFEPWEMQYYGQPSVRWYADGRGATFTYASRGYQRYRLMEIDATTGNTRALVDERDEPWIDITNQHRELLRDGAEILWSSARDGWPHLYLYDGASGAPMRQVTSGAFVVRGIAHVNERSRTLYFLASGREPGRDPYLVHVYRVGLDGSGLRLLTPEPAQHTARFSPSGRFFVDSYSRVDLPPVTVVRRASDGAVVMRLEEADVSRLLATGWRPPEPFTGKARDGVTDIYGLIWRPSHFDSTRRYPIVEQIYTGPHSAHVPRTFDAYRNQAQVIAELGFISVMIDGMGTAHRGKAFHRVAARNLGDGGSVEHVALIRAMAARYGYLDATRVGIWGHSAGGYDALHAMLTQPDFYRVGVSSAGNHDHRMDKTWWVEQWMGYPVGQHYAAQSNVTLAPRLRGKLLLMHGELDENVHPASTLQVVDALIKADRDFDMVIFPGRSHGLGPDPHFVRRRWDYFVRHLLGVEPPAGFTLLADRQP